MVSKLIIVLAVFAVAAAQRSPYAGKRPVGYPSIEPTQAQPENNLINRIGKEDVSSEGAVAPPSTQSTPTSTELPLPIEARGDWELVEMLSKLPQDDQPFWLLNRRYLEEQRKKPQTYQQRANTYIHRESDERFIFY